jgi:hypothetical protein
MDTPRNQITFTHTRPSLIRSQFVAALISLLGIIQPLIAGSLIVPNYSFESPATTYAFPGADNWQETPQPASYGTNGGWNTLAGIFLNAPSNNADYIDNAVGNQLGYLFAQPQCGFFQDYNSTDWSGNPPTHAFNATFQPGKSYDLTVAVTGSREEPLTEGSTLLVELYYRDASNNMITVAATTVTYDTNVFANITHLLDFHVDVPEVKTSDPWAGQNVGILIESSTQSPALIGGVWDFDNVRLTETIPDPSITVPNFSFEFPATAFAFPGVNSWQETPQPATYDTNAFGPWNQLIGVFSNAPGTVDYIGNAVGSQLGFIFGYPQCGFFQDYNSTDWMGGAPTHAFNATFQVGQSYHLTVGLTSSQEAPLTQGSTLLVALYYRDVSNNIVTVAATNVTYDPNVFNPITNLLDFHADVPSVKASDAWAGQNIGILFESTVSPALLGGVWDLDNVRLVAGTASGPTLVNPARANGQFSFTLQSDPGLRFQILATMNVSQPSTNWTSIGTVTNTTGTMVFTDPATNLNTRFYRARQLP